MGSSAGGGSDARTSDVAAQELRRSSRWPTRTPPCSASSSARWASSPRASSSTRATRHDYQGALDAYEHAKRAVPRLASADQVTAVVDTLSSGRYLLACVRAGLEGRPRPELRAPCFFNPPARAVRRRRPLHGARWARYPDGAGLRPGRRPGRGGREARDPQGTRRPERDAVLAGR